ncbi:MAG: RNA polymerase factor sigma-54 [Gammaproteobacteria bacterium]|nr:RNA polymerase factor sigma-54 [Gammaproteobacteria bacterium]
MKQAIQLRLGQHLTMTPQLQQAIRLLQLSTLELQGEIQEALDSNLMLELAEDESANIPSDHLISAPSYDTPPAAHQAEQNDASDASSEEPKTQEAGEAFAENDWEETHESFSAAPSGASDQEGREYENLSGQVETLREHLQWQLRLTPMNDSDRAIAEAIIDAVNDDGYLSESLEEIQKGLAAELPEEDVTPEAIAAVLHRVQRFDPLGVAARDLRECLLIQLQHCPDTTPCLEAARRLVDDYLPLLGSRDYAQLMRRMKLGEEELREVVQLIQSLHPRPGEQIAQRHADYIVPDVYVRKQKSRWRVTLNPEATPKLRINHQYASLIRRANNSLDNNCLKNHLQEARWFLKSLQSRNETLLRVARCIVERQRDFLEHGEEAMRPLVLHDVAEALGMHESTISRVTRQKYLHTPRGVFELKYFFSSHVSTESGGECSATAIRALIKKLVAAEHAGKPLSDSKIAELLVSQGINVARRTVAKYREAMAIPPSNERKRLV